MDAIKKKMQAMKVEKDNAMDRSDACEQAAKDAKIRAEKAEEEVAELVKKAQQLEVNTCFFIFRRSLPIIDLYLFRECSDYD